jgi:hypothetical protein
MTRADLVGTTLKATETFVATDTVERTTAAERFENLYRRESPRHFDCFRSSVHLLVVPVQTSAEHVIFDSEEQVQP